MEGLCRLLGEEIQVTVSHWARNSSKREKWMPILQKASLNINISVENSRKTAFKNVENS